MLEMIIKQPINNSTIKPFNNSPTQQITNSTNPQISNSTTRKITNELIKNVTTSANKLILIEVTERKIIIKCPKNNIDTKFLLSIRYSRWDKTNFCWIVPNYPGNLDVIKEFFKEEINCSKNSISKKDCAAPQIIIPILK